MSDSSFPAVGQYNGGSFITNDVFPVDGNHRWIHWSAEGFSELEQHEEDFQSMTPLGSIAAGMKLT